MVDEPAWELTRWTEQIGPHRVALTGLADFERSAEVADRHARAVDPRRRVERSPMFGVIWPSGRALAHRVAVDAGIPGADVLELACGLALPSFVAAARGARALATDNHPSAAGFLARNLRDNPVHVGWTEVDLRDPPALSPATFDRVLAADLLFAREMPALVAAAFARWLAPRGQGWLADPGRAWLPEFAAEASARGLALADEVVASNGVEVFLIGLTWRDRSDDGRVQG